MKKLMITAAAAAMIGSAQAVVCANSQCGDAGAGTAYKVAISLKTTDVKSKTTRLSKCDEPECYYWRQQATKKIDGLIWAGLDECSGCYVFGDGTRSAFWTKEGAIPAEFGIKVGMIGNSANSKKIEAYGMLTVTDEDTGDLANLSWAGFGTMASSVKGKTKCEEGECLMYPKSITGGIAGWYLGPEWFDICGDTCEPLTYTGCCDDVIEVYTAAYGTIKISYDASTAKKVALANAEQRSLDNPSTFFKVPAAAASDIAEDPDTFVVDVVIEE